MMGTFCFNEEVIGTVFENHLGLGWMSTFANPSPAFVQYEVFFQKYSAFSKLRPKSDEWVKVKKELRKQYGELMNPESWTLRDNAGKIAYRMAGVPVVSFHKDYFSLSWKKK